MIKLYLEAETAEELKGKLQDLCAQFGVIQLDKRALAIEIYSKETSFIGAIKEFRIKTNSTLKEAKEEIEAAQAILGKDLIQEIG